MILEIIFQIILSFALLAVCALFLMVPCVVYEILKEIMAGD